MHLSYSRDISQDFEYSYENAKLIKRILKQSEVGDGVRVFSECARKLNNYSYWFILGELWINEVDGLDVSLWKMLFSSDRINKKTSLMKPSELRRFNRMPDEIIIYRAKRKGEEDWIAYTVDFEYASRVAALRGVDVVHEYVVKKEDVTAVFLRNKMNVLVLDNRKPKLKSVIKL